MQFQDLKKFLQEIAQIMQDNKDYLIDLDQVVGDGDLGLTMSDGFKAAAEAGQAYAAEDLGMFWYGAGKAMANAVPSTMGTLMASGLMQAGKALKGQTTVDASSLVIMLQAYEEGVIKRGGAKLGEKTFLDGFHPGVTAFVAALAEGQDLAVAGEQALKAAEQGFQDTTKMIAVHGRAATRGEASRSLEDPGAAVAVLIFKALQKTFASCRKAVR